MLPQRPNMFVLSAIPWNVFCTLTSNREGSRNIWGAWVDSWARWVARASRLNFRSNFFAAVRFERGEVGGRLHAHALLRIPKFALGFFLVPGRGVPVAHKRWGRGLTRFRRVLDSEPAIAYLDKLLQTEHGADAYERGKSDAARDMVLSEAVISRAVLQQSDTCAMDAAPEGPVATLTEKTLSQRARERRDIGS